MPAATTNGLTDAPHQRGTAFPENEVLKIATDSTTPVVHPKSRTTRPRPCFDDGSLTRVFKFPSRTYPRSTYYVTSSEVIIRIKKSRKKWKLVVPKKRVVSYRTNRWFAKPRWIELVLTFTQASRLGLVELRKTPRELGGDASAGPQPTSDGLATRESFVEPAPLIASEIDVPSDGQVGRALEAEVDALAHQIDDDAHDFELILDQPEDWNQSIQPETELVGGAPELSVPCLPAVEFDSRDPQPLPVVETGRLPSGVSRKPHAVLRMAVMALLFVTGAGAWLTFGALSVSQTADIPTCPRSEPAAPCAHASVTDATEAVASLRGQNFLSRTFPDIAPSSESVAATTIQVVPKASAGLSESLGGWPESQTLGTGRIEPTLPKPIAMASDPSPSEEIAVSQHIRPPEGPIDRHYCRDLAAAAQSMTIRFDYASPHLDRTILTSLAAIAQRLQSCPSARVIIEGHTDSDGHEDRNETLSWRRAEAVREHLVTAGAKREQLSVIGYGHSRPYLPNVSTENKRKNRRAALIVEHRP